jgi:2-polyprenyl-6-methoxyphenol hydroxylase-like FAD-dependent oxidoreductase
MVDVERILIVGGGIAGLSVATALHQQGYRADLVERSPSWHTVGAGIFLMANDVRVLRALGLGDAVQQAGTPIRRLGFFDQHGRKLCATDLQQMWGEVGLCVGISRVRLQQALIASAAPVTTRLGTSVTSLTQGEDRVSVGSSDGSTADYDLVVGADGIYSTVRRLTISSTPLHVGPCEWVDLERWHTGRVVLIGDAAHACPPNMAEGGCMAIEDALVLAEELRSADTVKSALDRYVAKRRPRADRVQAQSRIVAESWVLPTPVRNAALAERGDQLFCDRYQPLLPAA